MKKRHMANIYMPASTHTYMNIRMCTLQ